MILRSENTVAKASPDRKMPSLGPELERQRHQPNKGDDGQPDNDQDGALIGFGHSNRCWQQKSACSQEAPNGSMNPTVPVFRNTPVQAHAHIVPRRSKLSQGTGRSHSAVLLPSPILTMVLAPSMLLCGSRVHMR